MVAFKNSTGIKANSSFCTFRFPIAEAHQLTKPFQYQPITTTSPTQPFAHFVFMPIQNTTFYRPDKPNYDKIYFTIANGDLASPVQLYRRAVQLCVPVSLSFLFSEMYQYPLPIGKRPVEPHLKRQP